MEVVVVGASRYRRSKNRIRNRRRIMMSRNKSRSSTVVVVVGGVGAVLHKIFIKHLSVSNDPHLALDTFLLS